MDIGSNDFTIKVTNFGTSKKEGDPYPATIDSNSSFTCPETLVSQMRCNQHELHRYVLLERTLCDHAAYRNTCHGCMHMLILSSADMHVVNLVALGCGSVIMHGCVQPLLASLHGLAASVHPVLYQAGVQILTITSTLGSDHLRWCIQGTRHLVLGRCTVSAGHRPPTISRE